MKHLKRLSLFWIALSVLGALPVASANERHGDMPHADSSRSGVNHADGDKRMSKDKDKDKSKHKHKKAKSKVRSLIAVMEPTGNGSASGTVTFEAVGDDQVKVTASFTGLNPDSTHAIHVHEFGDIRADDGTAAGGHYNPEGHPHALPDADERHAGDFGNLSTNSEGEAEFTITVDNISLAGYKNPVIGRAVIVHAREDDGGQPTGNAGGRISQGVIGVLNGDYTGDE